MITVSFSFVYGFLIDGITDICTISIYFRLALVMLPCLVVACTMSLCALSYSCFSYFRLRNIYGYQ